MSRRSGKKNNKATIIKKLNYWFDNFVSKGFAAQFAILFGIIALILVLATIVVYICSDRSMGIGLWNSVTHILDPGTVGGDDLDEVGYIVPMFVVTLLGLAFTGTIVGIINNAIEDKLDNLRKGHSQIIEKGHVVVIGFDDNIHTILSEIKESNENQKRNKPVVVIDNLDKEEMEHIVAEREAAYVNRDVKRLYEENHSRKGKINKTPIIFRSGDIVSERTFEMASIEKARAIIINKEDDFTIVRVILSLVNYLKKHNAYFNTGDDDDAKIANAKNMPTIVTMMHKGENQVAAAIAAGVYHKDKSGIAGPRPNAPVNDAELKVRVLYFENILAHIFAQVCRQPGLSWVIDEIFDYANSEIYIEDKLKGGASMDVLVGKTFGEISEALKNSIAIGFLKKNDDGQSIITINPPPRYKFEKGDMLIHLAEDDDQMEVDFDNIPATIENQPGPHKHILRPYRFLIFGWSVPLPEIVRNIDRYARKIEGSSVTILSRHNSDGLTDADFDRAVKVSRKTLSEVGEVGVALEQRVMNPYNWNQVEKYLNSIDWKDENTRPTNFVIMCQDGVDNVAADEKAAVLLINVRNYLRENDLEGIVNITSEMNLPENELLLSENSANDFIVGSEIANRMMVQVANNPFSYPIFNELLNDYNSEIYLRDFSEYVDISKPFNFRTIQKNARERAKRGNDCAEVALGWIRVGHAGKPPFIRLNPVGDLRNKEFVLDEEYSYEDYKVVILAKEEEKN